MRLQKRRLGAVQGPPVARQQEQRFGAVQERPVAPAALETASKSCTHAKPAYMGRNTAETASQSFTHAKTAYMGRNTYAGKM